MSETGKKKRRSRRTKEEKMMEKIAKEQEKLKLKEQEIQREEQKKQQMNEQMSNENEYERIRGIISQDNGLFQSMVNTDVRVKYGFIKTLHNNLISINSRFNWKPEELMAIGSIFRDFQNIEMNVYNTVIQQNNIEEEEEEEEEEEPEEEVEVEPEEE